MLNPVCFRSRQDICPVKIAQLKSSFPQNKMTWNSEIRPIHDKIMLKHSPKKRLWKTKSVLSSKSLYLKDNVCDILSMCWIPKLHKNPYKQRFIAGSANVPPILNSILTAKRVFSLTTTLVILVEVSIQFGC